MDAARIIDSLDGLFARARETDEFEYACALLRVRGMEDVGWDPLEETAALFGDIGSLLQAPLNDYARIRLRLLLYSHLTEVDAIYEMLVNMLEITAGERYTVDPFGDLYRPEGRPRHKQYPPSAKRVVKDVKKKAAARGEDEIKELLDWFFNDAVRNAFFHSDYVLFKDEFRSREDTFVGKDGVPSPSMKLDDQALTRLAGALPIEQNDEWPLTRRYLSEGSTAELFEQNNDKNTEPSKKELQVV